MKDIQEYFTKSVPDTVNESISELKAGPNLEN